MPEDLVKAAPSASKNVPTQFGAAAATKRQPFPVMFGSMGFKGATMRSAAACIAAACVLGLTLFAPGVLSDGDTFLHISAGNWMIPHWAVPQPDPFTISVPGAPWVAHQWLAEILLAAAFRLARWDGVLVLTAGAAAMTFFQLGHHLRRWLPNGVTLLLLLLAAACAARGLLARPHIIALPCLEAWVAGLLIARSEGRPPSWRLLPVIWLWANMHGGFIIGLALVLPLGVEALLLDRARWRLVALRWGGFLVAATAICLITPQGWKGLLFPLQLASMPGLSVIEEWQSSDFSALGPFELTLIAGLFFALSRGFRLPPMRLLVALGLLHLSLQHNRHQLLVAIIMPLLIAEPLGLLLPQKQVRAERGVWRPWYAVGVAVAAALISVRLALPVARTDAPTAPITALAHVPPALAAQPVFNDYAFGGYLIFAKLKPFIDGRVDMYGGAFLNRYMTIIRPDRQALDEAEAEYGIRWTILAPGNPMVALLDALPGWCRLYADAVAVVHTRSCPVDVRS